ncbi:MAG TPA: hypothetical protein VMI55_07840 [Thermoplasmata archaeon]|nr:hypothetical protein [Thermoplasmata archaeon]
MAGSGWGATGAGAAPLGILVPVLVLLSGPTGLGATSLPPPPTLAVEGSTGAPLPAAPNLTVSPNSTWADAGNATTFQALWNSGSPACEVTPVWFHWFVGVGSVGGLLSGQNVSTVNFTGSSARTGSASVGVRSAAVLRCGNQTDGLLLTAFGSVVEVAALAVDGLTAAPAPLLDGGQANLSGRIEGGLPPYDVTVRWGDGSQGIYRGVAAGPFRWPHTFATGTYTPELAVVDSLGNAASSSTSQPLQVSSAAAAAVTGSATTAEVGRPVQFTGAFFGLPPDAYSRLTGCGETSTNDSGGEPQLACRPTTAGPLPISLLALAGSEAPVLTQTLEEPVAAALSVQVSAPTGEAEVGAPALFDLRIAGGVPPFTLAWSFEAGAESGQEVLTEDGLLTLPVAPNASGFAPLSLTVVDADGAVGSVTNASLYVVPSLGVDLTLTSAVLPAAAQVDLEASVEGGVGPVAWVLLCTPSFTSGEPPSGWLPGDSSLRWSGSFPYEGAGEVELAAVDTAGVLATESATTGLVPPLTGQIAVSALNTSSGPAVTVDLNLSGGAPPLSVWINASGGASWNATDPADGPFAATVPMTRAGPSSVDVVVVDRLGATLSGRTFVVTAAPPDPPPAPVASSSISLEIGVLGSIVVALVVAAYVRLRRRPNRTHPAVDPTDVLEKILAPADGAERVTVELLAEEAGVPLETVRSTLAHLIATGRVRSEVSPDGEEVLAWSDAPAR